MNSLLSYEEECANKLRTFMIKYAAIYIVALSLYYIRKDYLLHPTLFTEFLICRLLVIFITISVVLLLKNKKFSSYISVQILCSLVSTATSLTILYMIFRINDPMTPYWGGFPIIITAISIGFIFSWPFYFFNLSIAIVPYYTISTIYYFIEKKEEYFSNPSNLLGLVVVCTIGRWFYSELSKSEYENRIQLKLLASQVSHDIRSPVSALNMIYATLNEISEEKKSIIRDATQRINDIANDLLSRGKQNENVYISIHHEINSLIEEKKFQYKDKVNIEFVVQIENDETAYANINGTNFKRAISNLINNSVEAIGANKGRVLVKIKTNIDVINIWIEDDGPGIPDEIIQQVGLLGVTHGKENTFNGSGLGIYYTKKSILDCGGTFEVEANIKKGTRVKISLPKYSK